MPTRPRRCCAATRQPRSLARRHPARQAHRCWPHQRHPVPRLPGNPISLFVTFCLFGHPMILKRQGATELQPRTTPARADFSLDKPDPRTRYLRARVIHDAQGQRATLYPDQGSGIISSTTWASALAEIPPNTAVTRGDAITIYPSTPKSLRKRVRKGRGVEKRSCGTPWNIRYLCPKDTPGAIACLLMHHKAVAPKKRRAGQQCWPSPT
ncbi:hypothetical protein [Aquisalimonas sp.]|uniref:hypothetical protein n=1 Tax=Aquisalimonas sp. TaxID=1872621 RepID=UPI003451A435